MAHKRLKILKAWLDEELEDACKRSLEMKVNDSTVKAYWEGAVDAHTNSLVKLREIAPDIWDGDGDG